MVELTPTSPALLFPAISLLFLAYTNRFLVLAQLIRRLKDVETQDHSNVYLKQIQLLHKRITYIKYMQALGVVSFIFCTLSIFSLLLDYQLFGAWLLGLSLLSLLASLVYSLIEILMSTNALSVELEGMEKNI